jgi:tetratricopeptide (TPR) repeat protein
MQAILDLRLKDARSLISEERQSNPGNGFAVYLEHYSDCIELIVTEDTRVYDRLIDSYSKRMEMIDRMDDGTPCSSWLQAEILFQTGLAQVKFGTRINGVTKMLSSFERIKSHRRKYPDFWQNRKLTGVFNIVLDNIPPFLRWAADLFGYTGDSLLGLYQLENYAEQARNIPGLAEEGVIMVNLGCLLARDEEKAFETFRGNDPSLLEPVLVKYLYANSATFVYRNDVALSILSGIDKNELQVGFYALPYATGRCRLNHLEPDAKVYLLDFIENYEVLDYKKAACNRLSYSYFLEGNMEKYEEYKAKVFTIGQTLRDRDQEAVLESSDPLLPHADLLRARFLCDGGYFDEALGIVNTIRPETLSERAYRLEYHYRKGRILQLSGKPDQAIPELTRAYEDGKTDLTTFATRSALNLGKIYEDRKEYALAVQWYERCLQTFSQKHTTQGVEESASKSLKRIKSK